LETGEFISSEITVKGPHPELDSDFTLFCLLSRIARKTTRIRARPSSVKPLAIVRRAPAV